MNKEHIEQLAKEFLKSKGIDVPQTFEIESMVNFTEHLLEKGEVRHKDETFECALCEREKSIFNRTEGRPNVCENCNKQEYTNQSIATPAKVTRLTEMSEDHFSKIFYAEGFAPEFVKKMITSFYSLAGFHMVITNYGRFESHRLATELGYDVEFTLDRPEWMREQLTGKP